LKDHRSGWHCQRSGTGRHQAEIGEYILVMFILAFGTGLSAGSLAGKILHQQPSSLRSFSASSAFHSALFTSMARKISALFRFNDQLADMLNLMVNGLRQVIQPCKPWKWSVRTSRTHQRRISPCRSGNAVRCFNGKGARHLLRRIPATTLIWYHCDQRSARIRVGNLRRGNLQQNFQIQCHPRSVTCRQTSRVSGVLTHSVQLFLGLFTFTGSSSWSFSYFLPRL